MFGSTPNTPIYMKVEQGEEAQPLHPSEFSRSQRSQRPWMHFLQLLGKITICVLATYGFYSAVRNTVEIATAESHSHSHTHFHDHTSEVHDHSKEGPTLHDDGFVTWSDHRSCSCGATVDEAIENGCKWDSHALAWLPDHCRDDELTAEFEKLGPRPDGSWELYADPERQHPLNFSNISMHPGTEFYMTMEWHDMHCAYTWRKLYRSRVLGITMDRKSDGLHHITHCTNEFLRRAPLQELTTLGHVDLDADHPIKE